MKIFKIYLLSWTAKDGGKFVWASSKGSVVCCEQDKGA
jgi:hypothetical protein